jgi:quercetin dioxygenase-like cupin family protein
MNRRVMLDKLMMVGVGTILSARRPHNPHPVEAPMRSGGDSAGMADKTVLEQELPHLTLDNWKMTAIDVTYAPGEMDPPHRHPGFVFGYVVEGSLRFQIDGGQATTYHAGQMFYEPPGSTQRVSGNASATQPARLLAMIFADKTLPLTTPV